MRGKLVENELEVRLKLARYLAESYRKIETMAELTEIDLKQHGPAGQVKILTCMASICNGLQLYRKEGLYLVMKADMLMRSL